ncbi:MAG: wax ester/triacylglycerol synthase domain-containing protein, partial [Actinomycetota bacterium]
MDALSPLDAGFLHIETDRSQMHVGSVTIFEGPAPSYDDYVGAIERVLHLVPRYRQKVRFVPL